MTEWLEYESEWGYWINPDTFRTPRIKKSIRVGAVFYEKNRETLDDGRSITVTTYGVARTDGTKEMGKREVSNILTKQMLEYMKTNSMFPPNTSVKKSFANGNVDLGYSPSDYDRFTVRLTPSLVGGNVEDFLDDLNKFEEKKDEEASWKIEPAKSSRSSCRTCGSKIQKDELRIGEPDMYDGHITHRWHHLSCQANAIRWLELESLDGYSELSAEQKNELKGVKSG